MPPLFDDSTFYSITHSNDFSRNLEDRLSAAFPGLRLEIDRDIRYMSTVIIAEFRVNNRRFRAEITIPWIMIERRSNDPDDLFHYIESRLRASLVEALQDPQSAPEERQHYGDLGFRPGRPGFLAELARAEKEAPEKQKRTGVPEKAIKTRKIRLPENS